MENPSDNENKFVSSEDIGEKRLMHSKSESKIVMTVFDTKQFCAEP